MSNAATHQISVSIGGKIGEWAQGINRNGDPVIYSLTVTKSPFKTQASVERSHTLSILINRDASENHFKTRQAVLALGKRYGFSDDCNYRIVIDGSPPRGKGLGSSSIDVASALAGVREARKLKASDADLYGIMCRIERSDYLFDPERIFAANPLEGTHSIVTRAPECTVLAWDTEPEKSINTEAVRDLDKSRTAFEAEYRDIFEMISTGEIALILRAATGSAGLNNRLLPKAGFEAALQLVKDVRDIGLVAAHTGTCLGFVLPRPTDEDISARISDFFTNTLKKKPLIFRTGATAA
jgi:L-threonine kinase